MTCTHKICKIKATGVAAAIIKKSPAVEWIPSKYKFELLTAFEKHGRNKGKLTLPSGKVKNSCLVYEMARELYEETGLKTIKNDDSINYKLFGEIFGDFEENNILLNEKTIVFIGKMPDIPIESLNKILTIRNKNYSLKRCFREISHLELSDIRKINSTHSSLVKDFLGK